MPTATALGIPAGRPVIETIGRTEPAQGIDLLIDAAAPLRDQVHMVVIAVPFDGDDPLAAAYQAQIRGAGLSATLVPTSPATCPASPPPGRPARGEPLANVPFETALWARYCQPACQRVQADRDIIPSLADTLTPPSARARPRRTVTSALPGRGLSGRAPVPRSPAGAPSPRPERHAVTPLLAGHHLRDPPAQAEAVRPEPS
jgi:hypothetical protein